MTPDKWLESYYGGEFFNGRLEALKKIQLHAELFFEKEKVITIAGTNGKGETSRYLNKLLCHDRISTALWTSPHLLKVNERFNFNGVDISDIELITVFESLKLDIDFLKIKLSYFEFLFTSFLYLAKEKSVSNLILEVGLGGRLDAVNILDADLVLLTSISRDHTELLGERYDLILKEKLGVLRQNKMLISSLELKYLRGIVSEYTSQTNTGWIDLFKSKKLKPDDNFSKRNKSLALSAYSYLFKKETSIDLSEVFMGVRSEITRCGAKFSLFPSHNVDGVRKLVHFLKQVKYTNYNKLLISFSERDIKEVSAMMEQLLELFHPNDISLFMFKHFKAINTKKLKQLSEQYKIKIYSDQNYFEQVKNEQQILVTGSNYFLGYFLSL